MMDRYWKIDRTCPPPLTTGAPLQETTRPTIGRPRNTSIGQLCALDLSAFGNVRTRTKASTSAETLVASDSVAALCAPWMTRETRRDRLVHSSLGYRRVGRDAGPSRPANGASHGQQGHPDERSVGRRERRRKNTHTNNMERNDGSTRGWAGVVPWTKSHSTSTETSTHPHPPPGARKKHKSRLHFDQKPSREEGNMTRVIKRVGGSCAQRTAAARWPDWRNWKSWRGRSGRGGGGG